MEGKAPLICSQIHFDKISSCCYAELFSIFMLPKSLCSWIDATFRKFLWGFNGSKKHNLTPLAWAKVWTPKNMGGLGIRAMMSQNKALAKLGWKSLEDLLWVNALK